MGEVSTPVAGPQWSRFSGAGRYCGAGGDKHIWPRGHTMTYERSSEGVSPKRTRECLNCGAQAVSRTT